MTNDGDERFILLAQHCNRAAPPAFTRGNLQYNGAALVKCTDGVDVEVISGSAGNLLCMPRTSVQYQHSCAGPGGED